jgi:acetyltransferase-like isoleucine patch superfamily enzyme
MQKCTAGKEMKIGLESFLINRSFDPKRVVLGRNCTVRGIIRVEREGSLVLGDLCYIGDRVIFSIASQTTVEEGVLFAHGSQVFDNDSHPMNLQERINHMTQILLGHKSKMSFTIASRPIRIGAYSWIGMNAVILKGTSLGRNCIVSAGSIVRGEFPDNSLIAGNPAIRIGEVSH